MDPNRSRRPNRSHPTLAALAAAFVVVVSACSSAAGVQRVTSAPPAAAPPSTMTPAASQDTMPPSSSTPSSATAPRAVASPVTTVPQTTVTTETVASSPTTAPPTPPAPPYPDPAPGVVERWVPDVLATYPHDPSAWTQGLVVRGNVVYESTGLYGESTVRIVDRTTGQPERVVDLGSAEFGEGLELVGDRLVQLTWKEEAAIVWDAATLAELDRLAYEGEGWGLCSDGERLVMSDGSATLALRDPGTFAVISQVTVTLGGEPVTRLNELECVDGLVFANVWLTTDIVVIDPASGMVVAVVDAAALDTVGDESQNAVLNGIAYDADAGVFLVTGKLWPVMYEVRFVEG